MALYDTDEIIEKIEIAGGYLNFFVTFILNMTS